MLAFVALLAVGPAGGDAWSRPSGGDGRTTSLERRLTAIAASLAGSGTSIECASPDTWAALSARDGFDPVTTWGTTPLREVDGTIRPLARSSLAPRTCRSADAFSEKPTERGSRLCRHGTTWRWVSATERRGARRAPARVRVAVLGECDGWASRLVAVHVVAHETVHLAGVADEAAAECLAMQVDAYVAMRLGARAAFARSMADEYRRLYYPEQDVAYRSGQCRDGGTLDLFPDRDGWPSPVRYPSDLRKALASFSSVTQRST